MAHERVKLALADLCFIRGDSISILILLYQGERNSNKPQPPPMIPRVFQELPRLTHSQQELILKFLVDENITHFGCSLMTGHFRAFRELAAFLRQSGWRGCIVAGRACTRQSALKEALTDDVDFVVAGPGERSLEGIIRNEPVDSISGLVYRVDGNIRKNPILDNAYLNLDSLPFPDYDFDNQYVIRSSTLEQVTPKIYKDISAWGGGLLLFNHFSWMFV